MKWVDEFAWIAATLDPPGCKFVTIGMNRNEFRKSVRQGVILRFEIQLSRPGKTSVQYQVVVYADVPDSGKENSIFTTTFSFVYLDQQGRKRSIPKLYTS